MKQALPGYIQLFATPVGDEMLCKFCCPIIGLFDESAVLIGRGHPRNTAPDHTLPGPRWPGGRQHLSNRCRVG
jgi:hypothetical protein